MRFCASEPRKTAPAADSRSGIASRRSELTAAVSRRPSRESMSTRSAVAAAARECVTRMPAARCAFTWSRSSRSTCAARVGIEIAGRLVGEHELRLVDERARDRDALQFAAGELARHARAAIAEPDRLEHRARPVCAAAASATPASDSGSATFCATVRYGSTWNAWKTKPIRSRRSAVSASSSSVASSTPSTTIEPASGRSSPAIEIEQRRLADARLAHHRDVVARRELEVDAREDGALPRPCVGLGELADREHAAERNGARPTWQAPLRSRRSSLPCSRAPSRRRCRKRNRTCPPCRARSGRATPCRAGCRCGP